MGAVSCRKPTLFATSCSIFENAMDYSISGSLIIEKK